MRVSWTESLPWVETHGQHAVAALMGSLAASFVIEQSGPPQVVTLPGGKEVWNAEDLLERQHSLRERVAFGEREIATSGEKTGL